jgi:two-component system, OmpR family, sensor histidine kinase KdpD
LLRAVGHDLRSPLASAKASVTSLRSDDVEWSESERAELLETADESLDRLSRLVDNLLDLSRLQAGVLPVFTRPMALDEILPGVLSELGDDADRVTVDIPHTLPLVEADPALLERVVANLLANAVRYSPAGRAPLVTGSALGDTVEIRVIDRGPGIPRQERDRVFAPFQRLGDTDNTVGVGLGLALARGLAEAMHGTLQPEDTPGGGLTMVVAIPTAVVRVDAPIPGARERSEQE